MSSLSLFKRNSSNRNSNFAGLLDVDRINANPVYTCYIQKNGGGGIQSISGIYNSDAPFSVSIQSDFVDQFELPSDIQDGFNQLAAGGNWMRNMNGMSQFILKSIRMTEQRWNGSSAPEFSLKLDIPIVRQTNAQWKALKYALQAVSGTKDEQGGNQQVQRVESAWQIFAPNGYKVTYSSSAETADTPSGVHSIALGKGNANWFMMNNAVITSIQGDIGPKKYYDGNPTNVTISIRFKFWRYPLYEDVIQWFPKMRLL